MMFLEWSWIGLFSSHDALSCISSFVICLVVVVWLFNIHSLPDRPQVFYTKLKENDSATVAEEVAMRCPILAEKYSPPLLWGCNGHLQAHAYGLFCRFFPPQLSGCRHRKLASDGATITFDVFSPSTYSSKKTKGCPIVAVIPGIGNGSDRPYVQVLVNELNQFGYTVVVLNHLGAVANEKLTSRRIFTYGGTDDLQLMIDWVLEEWPGRPIIGIGLSMGGNVLMKYLGEKPDRQSHFIGAATVCQGYNLMKAYPTWMSWQGLRRLYNFHITRNVLTVVRRHRDVLFSPLIHQRDDSSCDDGVLASQPNMKETLSATSLSEVDTHLQRYLAKFDTLEEYYDQHSCCHHLHKIANIPVLLLNTLDDPLVPEILLESARDYASCCSNALFVLTKHGSHLGFYEGGILIPNTVTWLDRMLTQFAQAVDDLHNSKHGME